MAEQLLGEWRSLVAHSAGGRAVAGSNPVSPTFLRPLGKRARSLLTDFGPHSRNLVVPEVVPTASRLSPSEGSASVRPRRLGSRAEAVSTSRLGGSDQVLAASCVLEQTGQVIGWILFLDNLRETDVFLSDEIRDELEQIVHVGFGVIQSAAGKGLENQMSDQAVPVDPDLPFATGLFGSLDFERFVDGTQDLNRLPHAISGQLRIEELVILRSTAGVGSDPESADLALCLNRQIRVWMGTGQSNGGINDGAAAPWWRGFLATLDCVAFPVDR